jgi:hypothetical protein
MAKKCNPIPPRLVDQHPNRDILDVAASPLKWSERGPLGSLERLYPPRALPPSGSPMRVRRAKRRLLSSVPMTVRPRLSGT